jgi:hypothetical protein
MAMDMAPKTIEGKVMNVIQPVTAGDYVLVMTAIADTVKDKAGRHLHRLAVDVSIDQSQGPSVGAEAELSVDLVRRRAISPAPP